MDSDDFDIYADLPEIEAEAKKEHQNVLELQSKINSLEVQILAKEEEKLIVVEKNKVLSENISSLLLTAKAELKRKDAIIADLRSKCDSTVFRRRYNHYREVQRVSKCTQTNYVRHVQVGVQVGEADDEHVRRNKKDDSKERHHERDRYRTKERGNERCSYRERDRDRVRNRHSERDKSDGYERDHDDRYRDRESSNRHGHRDRDKGQNRGERDHREHCDQNVERHRKRDVSYQRKDSERYDDRSNRGSSKECLRKVSAERQQGYQHDLGHRKDVHLVETTLGEDRKTKTKSASNATVQKNATKSGNIEDSLPNKMTVEAVIGMNAQQNVVIEQNALNSSVLDKKQSSGSSGVTELAYEKQTVDFPCFRNVHSANNETEMNDDESTVENRIDFRNTICPPQGVNFINDGTFPAATSNIKDSCVSNTTVLKLNNDQTVGRATIPSECMREEDQCSKQKIANISTDDYYEQINKHGEIDAYPVSVRQHGKKFELKTNRKQAKSCDYETKLVVEDSIGTAIDHKPNQCAFDTVISETSEEKMVKAGQDFQIKISDDELKSIETHQPKAPVSVHGSVQRAHNSTVVNLESYLQPKLKVKLASKPILPEGQSKKVKDVIAADSQQNESRLIAERNVVQPVPHISHNEVFKLGAHNTETADGPICQLRIETAPFVPNSDTSLSEHIVPRIPDPTELAENHVEYAVEHVKNVNGVVDDQRETRAQNELACLDTTSCDYQGTQIEPQRKETIGTEGTRKIGKETIGKPNDTTHDHLRFSEQDATPQGSTNIEQYDASALRRNANGPGSVGYRVKNECSSTEPPSQAYTSFGTKKRRISLESTTIAHKKHKEGIDRAHSSKLNCGLPAKLSDTFFSSIFLPIVSSLDDIHRDVASSKPLKPIVVHDKPTNPVISSHNFETSLILAQEKHEDRSKVFSDPRRKVVDLDSVHFSPQHLLASSTPLSVKPQSRLHNLSSSGAQKESDGGTSTAVPEILNSSKSLTTISSVKPVPCRSVQGAVNKTKSKATNNGKSFQNRKKDNQTNPDDSVHKYDKSEKVKRARTLESTLKMTSGTDERITIVKGTPSNVGEHDKKRIGTETTYTTIICASKAAAENGLSHGELKVAAVVQQENLVQTAPSTTLSLGTLSSPESNANSTNKMSIACNRQSLAKENVKGSGTGRISYKRSRASVSPGRAKMQETTNVKAKDMQYNISKLNVDPKSVGESCSTRTNSQGDVGNGVKQMVAIGDRMAEIPIKNVSELEKCHAAPIPLNAPPTSSLGVNEPNLKFVQDRSLQDTRSETTIAATTATGQTVLLQQNEHTNRQMDDNATFSISPASQRMCNFSLNLSLASATVDTDADATPPKTETPVRYVREMRIVKKNPKLMRVYINRKGD